MKKLFTLLLLATLISCRCLPQPIAMQIVYVDENCEAVMPDYVHVPWITARDNCEGLTITQRPAAGVILTEQYNEVMIKAEDPWANADSIKFDLFVIDTIPPEIIVGDSLLSDCLNGDTSYLLDAFQASIKPHIDSTTWHNSNYVVISSPDGTHIGALYDKDLAVITANKRDLETLGYRTSIPQQ